MRWILFGIAWGVVSFLLLAYAPTSFGQGQTIYVVNHSSVPNYKLADALTAYQQAVDNDFGPAWNAYANLELVSAAPPHAWSIELRDETDLWGAAGYHGLHGQMPFAMVGARTGINWELVFSHELFEMLADPYIDRASYLVECGYFTGCISKAFYIVEVADPVEALWHSYRRESEYGRSVVISDFVLPSWYTAQGGAGFDFLGHVKHHHEVMRGGYAYACRNGSWMAIKRWAFRR